MLEIYSLLNYSEALIEGNLSNEKFQNSNIKNFDSKYSEDKNLKIKF